MNLWEESATRNDVINESRKGDGRGMKIGIQTSTFDRQGYGRWGDNTYQKLKEHGYSCTDLDLSNTEENEIYSMSEKEAEKRIKHEKELADSAGIEIVQMHGPWRWPPRDVTAEERAERREKMEKSIRMASVIGCKNWVVHPIMPYGVKEIGTEDAGKTRTMNLEFMSDLLKTAKEYGVTICLENMPMHEFSLAKPQDILDLVREINDDCFKICLDTGHVSVFSDLNLKEEVIRCGKEIRTFHIHDNRHGFDMHLMPYFGGTDWSQFAEVLRCISFDGCFSLETMPPRMLGDEIFEDLCNALFKTAKEIAGVAVSK